MAHLDPRVTLVNKDCLARKEKLVQLGRSVQQGQSVLPEVKKAIKVSHLHFVILEET